MQGEAEVTLNLMNQKFHEGMLVYVGRGSVAQINRVTSDFRPYAMLMGDDFLNLASTDVCLCRSVAVSLRSIYICQKMIWQCSAT